MLRTCQTSEYLFSLPTLVKPGVNMNDYHCAAGHSRETLLRKTAEQQGIVLEVLVVYVDTGLVW